MDMARPYKAVCPSLDGEVLKVLAGTTRALTGREVALLTGRTSHSGVLTVLNRLTEHGLVDRVELNRASLFSANRHHLAWPAVEILVGIRNVLLDKMKREVEAWMVAPAHVSLFGSTARGDGNTASDVDLLIVRSGPVTTDDPAWRSQLDGLEDRIESWTGNQASILERSVEELKQLAAHDRPILRVVRAEGVVLTGPAIETLLEDR